MRYQEFEAALSPVRLGRYLRACEGDKRKAMALYRYNIKLAQCFYGTLGIFEVILRNAIDEHFRQTDADWLLNQANGGFLGNRKDSILGEYNKLKMNGNYTPDKLLSALSLGVWTFLFSKNSYRESGKTLLQIFPNKPYGVNQRQVYQGLDGIRKLRNRVAHFEPLCFNIAGEVDISSVRNTYLLIEGFVVWLGYNPKELLYGIDSPDKILTRIAGLVS